MTAFFFRDAALSSTALFGNHYCSSLSPPEKKTSIQLQSVPTSLPPTTHPLLNGIASGDRRKGLTCFPPTLHPLSNGNGSANRFCRLSLQAARALEKEAETQHRHLRDLNRRLGELEVRSIKASCYSRDVRHCSEEPRWKSSIP